MQVVVSNTTNGRLDKTFYEEALEGYRILWHCNPKELLQFTESQLSCLKTDNTITSTGQTMSYMTNVSPEPCMFFAASDKTSTDRGHSVIDTQATSFKNTSSTSKKKT